MKPYRLRSNNEGWLTSYADLITNLLIFFVLIISASQVQSGKMEKIIQSISQNEPVASLSSAEKSVKEELARQNLSGEVDVELTDSGLEIAFQSGVTFSSGSAMILPQMEEPLEKVLTVLKPYSGKYQMAVEGHTDERPIHSQEFRSNWELSSARAMKIREKLELIGIDGKRVRVEAYADNKPLKEEMRLNLDRETFFAKHRRVVIRLY
jgi:chemotaxis protein MotB